jgi:Tfp pilus assembly protein PilO
MLSRTTGRPLNGADDSVQFTLARLPWMAQAGVGAGMSAACAACFHLFWATPMRDERASHERALATAHRNLAAAVRAEKRLPEGRRHIAALRARLEKLQGADPRDSDAAAVLRAVQALAEQSGLWITGFKPVAPAVRGSVTEWSVVLEFDGTYASVVAFVQRVGDDPRLLGLTALRLRGHERTEDESTLTGACRLTTFVLGDVAAARTAKPGTAAPVHQTVTGEHAAAAGLP